MRSKSQLVFSFFLILIGGYVVFSASRWTFKAGFFPLAVAIPLIILVATHVVLDLFGASQRAAGTVIDAEFSSDVGPEVERRRAIAIFCWIAGFIMLVYLAGFPVAVPIFMFAYLKLQSSTDLAPAAGYTAAAWGFFYVVFQRLLYLPFEAGAIQTWLGL
jgi:hypothetical protein